MAKSLVSLRLPVLTMQHFEGEAKRQGVSVGKLIADYLTAQVDEMQVVSEIDGHLVEAGRLIQLLGEVRARAGALFPVEDPKQA